VPPPKQPVDTAKIDQNAQLDAKNMLDAATLPDTLALGSAPELTNPAAQLQGALEPVQAATDELMNSLTGVKELFELNETEEDDSLGVKELFEMNEPSSGTGADTRTGSGTGAHAGIKTGSGTGTHAAAKTGSAKTKAAGNSSSKALNKSKANTEKARRDAKKAQGQEKLPDLGNPFEPLPGALEPVQEASTGLLTSMGVLSKLLGSAQAAEQASNKN
jgi:hypothetical protein